MNRQTNKGSASIFMVLLLIPTVICMCILIRYAQLISAKGMMNDAQGLAENAVISSYNRPIKEAYGIICYTKSQTEMNAMGNYYFNKSLPSNMNGDIEFVYPAGYELTDNELLYQINKYMSRWDKVATVVQQSQTFSYIQMINDAAYIREEMLNHYNNAITAEGRIDITVPEAQAGIRQNAIPATKPDLLSLGVNQVYLNYGACAGDIIASRNREVSYQNSVYDNIQIGLDMLENVNEYYSPINDAFSSQACSNENYRLALYVYNNFSAFHYYGKTALTGNYYGSGDIVSVCRWGENEFILNATNDTINNLNKTKYLIYESLFAEKLVGLYRIYQTDPQICEYASLVAEGHTAYVSVIKDEMIIGMCAKLAYDELRKIYGHTGGQIFSSYEQYIQLFNMIEVERNKTEYLNRVKYIITINANNSSNEEAREFNFGTAKTRIMLEDCNINVDLSF